MKKRLSHIMLSLIAMLAATNTATATIHKCSAFSEFETAIALDTLKTDTILLENDLFAGNREYTSTIKKFHGVIDGQNHTIKGWTLYGYLFEIFDGTVQNIIFENINTSITNERSYINSIISCYSENAVYKNITLKKCKVLDIKKAYNVKDVWKKLNLFTNEVAFISGHSENCQYIDCLSEDCTIDLGCSVLDIFLGGVGMFASEAKNTVFDNCRVRNGYIRAFKCVGGIVGSSETSNCKFNNCAFKGSIEGSYYVGGISCAGYNSHFNNCVNYATVKGFSVVAGICSVSGDGYFNNCINYGDITSETYGAGIVSKQGLFGEISGCTNYGNVTCTGNFFGKKKVGDVQFPYNFFGGIAGEAKCTVKNCVNYGAITEGNDCVGGIVGNMITSSITGCVNAGKVSGSGLTGGITGQITLFASLKYCLNVGDVSGDYSGKCYGRKEVLCSADHYYMLDENGAFDEDKANESSTITSAELKSGVLAYYVNKEASQDLWGQKMNPNGTGIDNYPTPGAPIVYKHDTHANCKQDNTAVYYNNYNNSHYGQYLAADDKYKCEYCNKEIDYSLTENAVEIYNADDLVEFAAIAAKQPTTCALLKADIDCEDITSYTPIGTQAQPYCGTFDGLNHTISNLHVDVQDQCAGFFGYLGTGATVKNLIIDSSCSVNTTGTGAAGIAGGVYSDITQACNVTITNCGNEATVTAPCNAGAILGGVYNNDNTTLLIQNCYNTGTINGTRESAAICGYARKNFTIRNCWNSGILKGIENEKSFVRFTSGGSPSLINNYSTVNDQVSIRLITTQDVESGALCWMINGEEDGSSKNGWYQKMESSDIQSHPTTNASSYTVYRHSTRYCNETTSSRYVYTNSVNDVDVQHTYDSDGYCTLTAGETHYEKPASDADESTYYLSTPGNLYWIAENVNKGNINPDIELLNDITVNEDISDNAQNRRVWTPIGTKQHQYRSKTFNGNGYTISGLYLPAIVDYAYAGLFGVADYNAIVKNVGIVNSYFFSGWTAGKDGYAGSIIACGVNPNDTTETTGAIIQNCYSTATVSGFGWTGGMAGYLNLGSSYSDKLASLYFAGEVSANSDLKNYYMTGALFGHLGTSTVGKGYTGQLPSCYYLDGCCTNGKVSYGVCKSDNAFRYGEVCNLLNQNSLEGATYWQQQLDNDTLPRFGYGCISHARVITNRWGTLVVPFRLNPDDDITYYTVSSIDSDNNLHLTKVTTVEPNTPCFFRVAEGYNDFMVVDLDGSTTAPNMTEVVQLSSPTILTIGSYIDQTVSPDNLSSRYYIANNKLWLCEEDFSLPAFRAYLEREQTANSAKSLTIVVDEDGTATPIGNISADGNITFYDDNTYNLSGQRLSAPQKGKINIINGKKIFAK